MSGTSGLTGTPSVSAALLGFVHRLREAAVPVSMVEALDAMESLRHVELVDRSQFKAALAATLVKRAEHLATFDSLFDILFAVQREGADASAGSSLLTSLDRTGGTASPAEGVPEGSSDTPTTDLLEALLEALRSGDRDALRALSSLAVSRFGGIEAGRSASERYYVYRILRQLELSDLLRMAIAQTGAETEGRSALGDRLVRDELTRRVEEFRRMIAQEVRRQLVELKGASVAAEAFHDRPIEDVDFLSASPAELKEMREAIRPLAQKLAARIARRTRIRRHGRLDVRRTIRRSLSAGGVPLDPAFRFPRAAKPDLYLLADISGSVAEFARFTMSLLYAMKEEFSRIRLFVFVDGIDEVTELMDETGRQLVPRNLLYRTDVISGDGHSDYGAVFDRFWHVYGYADLDPRSTVIITGDARNNYRGSGIEPLRQIQARARKVYWLNPEPRREWGTTDSIIDEYAPACHGVFEARNLGQLADFVYAIT